MHCRNRHAWKTSVLLYFGSYIFMDLDHAMWPWGGKKLPHLAKDKSEESTLRIPAFRANIIHHNQMMCHSKNPWLCCLTSIQEVSLNVRILPCAFYENQAWESMFSLEISEHYLVKPHLVTWKINLRLFMHIWHPYFSLNHSKKKSTNLTISSF